MPFFSHCLSFCPCASLRWVWHSSIRHLKTAVKSLLCLLLLTSCLSYVLVPWSPTVSTGNWVAAVKFAQCLLAILPKRQRSYGCFLSFNCANLVTYQFCYSHCYRHLNLLVTEFVWMRRGNSSGSLSVLLLPQRSYRPWQMRQHIPGFFAPEDKLYGEKNSFFFFVMQDHTASLLVSKG